MTWTRLLVASGLAWALATNGGGLRAQTEPQPPTDAPKEQPKPEPKPETPPPPPPAPPGEPAKPGFWGDHFALYLEVDGGAGSSAKIEPSMETLASEFTISKIELDDIFSGRFVVGWKLPNERGSFLVTFNAYAENSYTFESTGYKRAVSNSTATPDDAAAWWLTSIHDGHLVTQRTPPIWTDNVIPNGFIDDGEVGPPPAPDLIIEGTVPDNTQNRLQAWDGLYQREFGGRAWNGRWSGGLRYLVYEGNIPATAWLSTNGSSTTPGAGYTDGASLRLLSLHEDASGWGPTGSIALQYHLFKRRLTLYGESRFAFLLQDLTVDSGNFFTLVRDTTQDPGVQLVSTARLEKDITKSSWNFGGEVGARIRVLQGFNINLAYNRTSFQDVILVPYSITIPGNPQEIPQGTVALFNTQDLLIDTFYLGLSFQF